MSRRSRTCSTKRTNRKRLIHSSNSSHGWSVWATFLAVRSGTTSVQEAWSAASMCWPRLSALQDSTTTRICLMGETMSHRNFTNGRFFKPTLGHFAISTTQDMYVLGFTINKYAHYLYCIQLWDLNSLLLHYFKMSLLP